MYRPTVRYHDTYRYYIDDLSKSTHLDRNQILRAALFAAAHSPDFQKIMSNYKRHNKQLPTPMWEISDNSLWEENKPNDATRRTIKGDDGSIKIVID